MSNTNSSECERQKREVYCWPGTVRGRGLCGLSGSLCGLLPQLDLGAGRFVAVSSAPVGLTLTDVLLRPEPGGSCTRRALARTEGRSLGRCSPTGNCSCRHFHSRIAPRRKDSTMSLSPHASEMTVPRCHKDPTSSMNGARVLTDTLGCVVAPGNPLRHSYLEL